MPPCDACLRAKSKRPPLPKAKFKRATEKLFRLHTDMSGFIPCKSIDGAHYFLLFIDDLTNYKWVYLLAHKDGFITALDKLIVRVG
eukprot:3924936-Rhodomonas_salina.1